MAGKTSLGNPSLLHELQFVVRRLKDRDLWSASSLPSVGYLVLLCGVGRYSTVGCFRIGCG